MPRPECEYKTCIISVYYMCDLLLQGGCKLTPAGYGHMTHMLSALANGRVILVLEVRTTFVILHCLLLIVEYQGWMQQCYWNKRSRYDLFTFSRLDVCLCNILAIFILFFIDICVKAWTCWKFYSLTGTILVKKHTFKPW